MRKTPQRLFVILMQYILARPTLYIGKASSNPHFVQTNVTFTSHIWGRRKHDCNNVVATANTIATQTLELLIVSFPYDQQRQTMYSLYKHKEIMEKERQRIIWASSRVFFLTLVIYYAGVILFSFTTGSRRTLILSLCLFVLVGLFETAQ